MIVTLEDGTATVTYEMEDGYSLIATELYIGSTVVYRDEEGSLSVMAEDFPYSNEEPSPSEDTYTVSGLSEGSHIFWSMSVGGRYGWHCALQHAFLFF